LFQKFLPDLLRRLLQNFLDDLLKHASQYGSGYRYCPQCNIEWIDVMLHHLHRQQLHPNLLILLHLPCLVFYLNLLSLLNLPCQSKYQSLLMRDKLFLDFLLYPYPRL
jgi:hypothetical protein